MQRKTNGPMEDAPKAGRSSRRDLLKRALVVLGAGVLIQPYGGISGLALAGSAPPKMPQKKTCGVAVARCLVASDSLSFARGVSRYVVSLVYRHLRIGIIVWPEAATP
jgi:hypothetical protein